MASMLSLKRRIRTAQNVSKTTKAMQMIAASKLKKAQNAALLSKAYVEKLSELTKGVSSKLEDKGIHPYLFSKSGSKRKLTIVLSPDKGLCGGMISNLLREIIREDQENPYYIILGKKAENALLKFDREVLAIFPFGTTLPSFDAVYPIIKLVEEAYLSGKVSEVRIISTEFTSVFTQTPVVKIILPLEFNEEENTSKTKFTQFEPSMEGLLPSLLNHYLEMVLYQSLLDNYASEQAARMIAMKNATDNAIEVIGELKLEYNKSRQEKITNEILDIGSGAFMTNYE